MKLKGLIPTDDVRLPMVAATDAVRAALAPLLKD
jgi:dihydrodipicolinate synthase/N-acetylneuraminate lyase